MKRKITGLLTVVMLAVMLVLPAAAQDDEMTDYEVGLELVAEGFVAPTDLDAADDSGRLFVTDQTGQIYVVDADGNLLEDPFLDIQDRMVDLSEGYDERGLLGVAFHPDFANNGLFYAYYSAPLQEGAPADWNHTSHVSEFSVSADNPNEADPNSERILMRIDEPQSNHNGGDITFGPDGYLYIPLGDGGAADDQGVGHTDGVGNGQDLTKLLGKILRIDVNNGDPYGIPDDNPFVGDDDFPDEIWAYGLRNPWRATWDDDTGRYFVADVGQNLYEEVNIVEAGQNYGWRIREGTHCFSVENPDNPPEECAETGQYGEPLQSPILEYSHDMGIAVVGGYVYRGEALGEEFDGVYFFGDWVNRELGTGVLWVATPGDEGGMWNMHDLNVTGGFEPNLLAFGEDASGELYVLTSRETGPTGNSGQVWRIVPAGNE
jgi:glucose/arabinose dehydrogenase